MQKRFFLSNHALYQNSEAAVCNAVLHAIQKQAAYTNASKSFTCHTKMFTEAGLTIGDIAHVIYQIRISLLVPFSYDLLLEQETDATIGDLAHGIWKGMLKAIEYN